jgi:hypothetical protein
MNGADAADWTGLYGIRSALIAFNSLRRAGLVFG